MIGALIAKAAVKKTFSSLNQKDLNNFIKGWHDDAVFHYPGDLSVSGTYAGKAIIKAWFEKMFNQFSSIKFTPTHICVENLFDVLGNNTLIVQVDIRLTNKYGVLVENSGAIFLRIKHGKVMAVRDYFFYPERLAIGWAESI